MSLRWVSEQDVLSVHTSYFALLHAESRLNYFALHGGLPSTVENHFEEYHSLRLLHDEIRSSYTFETSLDQDELSASSSLGFSSWEDTNLFFSSPELYFMYRM